ncbi:Ig-like domain-containing protein, partial [Ralstonia solanacearum]
MASPSVLNNHTDIPVSPATKQIAAPNGPANFLVAAHKDDVANYARSGNDLILEFKDGRELRIQGFFTNGADFHNLIFQQDGQVLAGFDGALTADGDGILDSAVTYEPIADSNSTMTLLGILGAAGVGLGIAAAGGGGGGGAAAAAASSGSVAPLTTPSVDSVDGLAASSGVITANTTPTVTGSGASPNAKVTISVDGQAAGTATADANGNWAYTLPTVSDGDHQITAIQTDSSGNSSTPTAAAFTVDTVAPAQPAIVSAVDDVDPVTGAVASGGSTNDSTPTFAGTAEAGSTITLYDNGTAIGTTTADASGNWTFTPSTALADGSHSITVTATDSAGNTSVASTAFTLTVDTAAPATPTLNPTDGTTLSGTAEAGSTVSIDLNGDGTPDATVTADGSGNWTYTPATPLTNGTVVSATETDPAGNVSPAATVTVTTTTVMPAAPVISTVTDDVAPVTGTITD